MVTTPFADDFNLITQNKAMHQKLVTDIAEKIKSMGLELKPQKCRSLSIEKGKIENIVFKLKDYDEKDINIDSIIDKPMKFLGSNLAGDNSPSAMFVNILSMLETKLKNINKSTLRGEFKLNIYSRYALPSMRYYFSVHQIHETHMQKLDLVAKKYVKIWLGIQKHGVSDASIFHPYMLSTKMPSQLYKEAHAGNFATIRSKGDSVVNHALDSRLERESSWTRKYSTVNHMQTLWQENIDKNTITLPHTEEAQRASPAIIRQAKKAMYKSVREETLTYWNERVQKLAFQGDFIQLLVEEKENITWKSIINNIPRGVLSFAMKSTVNGLNTPDNLKRWGIRKTNKCDQCGNFGNLEHTLNWCKTALDQGRFTWRHNSILNHLAQALIEANNEGSWIIYADIPGMNMNGGTIPPDVLITAERPDLVLLDRSKKSIELYELTCSFEKNIDSAFVRKSKKYNDLKSDLIKAGWTTSLIPFEIGSRGYVTKRNTSTLTGITKKVPTQIKHKKLITELSQISLLCSFTIFQARCQPTWQDPPLLHP